MPFLYTLICLGLKWKKILIEIIIYLCKSNVIYIGSTSIRII